MALKQPEKQNLELKTLDVSVKTFPANGKKYTVKKSMSFERFREYEKLQIETGYGVSFSKLYENIKSCYELVNKSMFADTAVRLHNMLSGIKNIEERRIPALRLCALFINYEGEDEKGISEELIDEKIADWEAEGYDILPFFHWAIASIPDFSIALKAVIQINSQLEELQKKKPLHQSKKK